MMIILIFLQIIYFLLKKKFFIKSICYIILQLLLTNTSFTKTLVFDNRNNSLANSIYCKYCS